MLLARFSPDGRRVLTLAQDGVVRILDAATGEVQVRLPGYPGHTRNALFSPDGTCLASADSEGVVRVWSARPVVETATSGEAGSR